MFGKIDNLSHRYLLEVRGTFVAMKLGWRVCLDSYRVKEDYITGMFALSLNIRIMPPNKSPSSSQASQRLVNLSWMIGQINVNKEWLRLPQGWTFYARSGIFDLMLSFSIVLIRERSTARRTSFWCYLALEHRLVLLKVLLGQDPRCSQMFTRLRLRATEQANKGNATIWIICSPHAFDLSIFYPYN